jgi:hypothetical protein
LRTYTWDEYYEKYYDWVESTQVRNLSALTSLGSADEVGEIIIELQVNVSAANRLLKKAVEAKLEFFAYDLIEFLCTNDKALATAAVYNSANRLTAEDMEDLYGEVDDEVIIEICSKRNLTLPEDLREEEEEPELEEDEPLEEVNIYVDDFVYEKPKKLGFFGTLFAVLGAAGSIDNSRPQKHNGRCNGDCADCPPHYGYRYGRWYYGKGHVHGCEFGGNKGDGSL